MVLDEAVAQSSNPDFKAEPFFINHQDIELSKFAAEISVDQYSLTQSKEVTDTMTEQARKQEEEKKGEQLRQQAEHLMVDFRMDYVDRQLKNVQQEIIHASSDPEKTKALMLQFRELQNLRNILARQVGKNLI